MDPQDFSGSDNIEITRDQDEAAIEPELILLIAGTGGTLFRGVGSRFLIGRSRDADLPLWNISISKKHCTIIHTGRMWMLEDLHSTFGTKLNGKELRAFERVPLKRGDRIDLAQNVSLIMESGDEGAEKAREPDESILDDLKEYIDARFMQWTAEDEFSATVKAERILPPPAASADLPRPAMPYAPLPGAASPGTAEHRPENDTSSPDILFLEDIIRKQEKTFSEAMLDLLQMKNRKDSEIYKRAEISRQLFSKIMNDPNYQPTKNTAMQLAIGLELDVYQTQKLLGRAGYALTPSSKVDLVVQYFIEREIFNVTFINDALFSLKLPLLKTGLKL